MKTLIKNATVMLPEGPSEVSVLIDGSRPDLGDTQRVHRGLAARFGAWLLRLSQVHYNAEFRTKLQEEK